MALNLGNTSYSRQVNATLISVLKATIKHESLLAIEKYITGALYCAWYGYNGPYFNFHQGVLCLIEVPFLHENNHIR